MRPVEIRLLAQLVQLGVGHLDDAFLFCDVRLHLRVYALNLQSLGVDVRVPRQRFVTQRFGEGFAVLNLGQARGAVRVVQREVSLPRRVFIRAFLRQVFNRVAVEGGHLGEVDVRLQQEALDRQTGLFGVGQLFHSVPSGLNGFAVHVNRIRVVA